MIKYTFMLWLVLAGPAVSAQTFKDGEELFSKMHTRYAAKPCRSYSFSQKNTHYKNDTVSGHSEWHEHVEFPDKFRIVFGSQENGNRVVFKNDSVFNYRKNQLVKSGRDTSSLLLILGGMYYRPYEDALARILKAGFKVYILSERTWNGEPVFVIGAKENDDSANQVWVEKKELKVVRILENTGGAQLDMRFESHQPLCRGYVENKVSFRRNGKLEQIEEYYDIKENVAFPE